MTTSNLLAHSNSRSRQSQKMNRNSQNNRRTRMSKSQTQFLEVKATHFRCSEEPRRKVAPCLEMPSQWALSLVSTSRVRVYLASSRQQVMFNSRLVALEVTRRPVPYLVRPPLCSHRRTKISLQSIAMVIAKPKERMTITTRKMMPVQSSMETPNHLIEYWQIIHSMPVPSKKYTK